MTINIFDFDGTLFHTPNDSEQTRMLYQEKTGHEYPHVGWFSKKETLDMDIFDISANLATYNLAKDSIKSNALTFLLTGRLHKLKSEVKNICNRYDLAFDRYYCNSKSNTLEYKKSVLSNIFLEFGESTVVNFYDDRIEHREELTEKGISLFKSNFTYIFVE